MLSLIVAQENKGGIGANNGLPWNIPDDLAYFKKVTTHVTTILQQNIVVMGRKTWESIPEKFRPLNDRINVVLTKNRNYIVPEGVKLFHSKNDVLKFIRGKNTFIIGGASLYNLFMDDADKIYLTHIYTNYATCDTYFPKTPDYFKLSNVSSFLYCNNHHYRNLVYVNTLKNPDATIWQNTEEQQFLNCMRTIITTGIKKEDRTGVGTLSTFGNCHKYNLSDTFPLLTTKRMFTRGIFEELMFYLSGKTDTKILDSKGVSIWNANTTREFLDKRGLIHLPEGDMGETYGFNLRHYGAQYESCKENYEDHGFDQLNYVLDLIKNNPESRRIIIDLWNCSTLSNAALPPCLCKYQFYVDTENKRLNLMIYLRSSDFFLANNWNVCTGAFLVHLICNLNGYDLSPGELTVISADTHIYISHLSAVEEQLTREPRPFPKLVIKIKRDNILDFKYEDIELIGYKPMKSISAEMAV